MPERIAKYIANCGYCSRREAEKLIEKGVVKLNSKIVKTAATLIEHNDKVEVNGKVILPLKDEKILLFHKPVGVICTKKDERGRKTIYDLLPKEYSNFHYIGRLDLNSEGLLLLTNSSEIKRYYELPKNNIKRIYKVRVYGYLNEKVLDSSEKRIKIKDPKTGKSTTYKAKIELDDSNPKTNSNSKNTWLKFTLKEGKNREIRKICEHFDLQVSRLIRISFGEYELGNLKLEGFKEITTLLNHQS